MKKFLFGVFFTLISLISLTSCDVDNHNEYNFLPTPYTYGWYWQPGQTDGNGQYAIGGYVAGTRLMTRAYSIQSSDVISDYSNFSLFSWTNDSTVMDNFTGTFSQETGTWGYTESKKFFDNKVSEYNFVGILPYSNYTLKDDKSIDVTGLTSFTTENVNPNDEKYNKEFIVAQTSVQKSGYAQGATLNFKHQNSIIRIKFETDEGNDLEIVDFTPHVDYQPATPGSKTEISSTVFEQLSAGNSVGYPHAGTSIYSGSKGNYNAVRGGNTATSRILNTRLEEIMPLVNAQFIYTNEDGTPYNEDWKVADNNKNKIFIKFAEGVDASAFIAGNDAFWSNLTAEEKTKFQNWYDSGIRVVRINEAEDATGGYFCWGIINTTMTLTVIGEGTPEVPESGISNVIVLPATSTLQTGKDAVLSTFPETVTANINLNNVTYTVNTTEQEVKFTKAGTVAYSQYSPTNWYTFPVVHGDDFGFTIKFSYTLNGVTRYDARVFVPKDKANWQPGKWYDYVIKVNSTNHGKVTPEEADPTDPKIDEEYPIIVNSSFDNYTSSGEIHEFEL